MTDDPTDDTAAAAADEPAVAADGAAEGGGTEPGVSRRERAVARSLYTARARAENRLQRFLDAAIELMDEGGPSRDFTVHDVVERSGQSLRLFYQYFGGKHELLLALFEESVRATADQLREQIADASDPLERMHRFVVDYHRLCRPGPQERRRAQAARAPGPPLMVDFALQLLTSHPNEAALAFAPVVNLFHEVLAEAEAAGSVRVGMQESPVAGMVLEAIMFNAFSVTLSSGTQRQGAVDPAEELWGLILHGVGL